MDEHRSWKPCETPLRKYKDGDWKWNREYIKFSCPALCLRLIMLPPPTHPPPKKKKKNTKKKGWRTTSQAWEFSKANWVQWEMQYIFFLPCCLRLIFGVANFLVTTKVITIITPTPAREFLKENGVQCKKPSLRLHHLSWLKSGSSTISSKRSTKAFNLVVDFAQHSGSIWK